MTAPAGALAPNPGRIRTLSSGVVFAGGFLMFGFGFIITLIQLFYTIHYLRAVFANAGTEALQKVSTLIPAWSRPFMVDLALVAPGLVGFTGACVALGASRILRGNEDLEQFDTFPFPKPYRTYYIQHGLLGAVFGFVIAFWNLKPDSPEAPTVMLAALGAALWSTLTAITLAYFLCPIIEWVFQRHLIAASDVYTDEDPLLVLDKRAHIAAAALERLASTASSVDVAFTLRTLDDQLVSLRRELVMTVERVESADKRISLLEGSLRRASSDLDGVRAIADKDRRNIEKLLVDAASLRKEIGDGETRMRRDLEPLRKQLQQMALGLTEDQQRRRNELARIVETGAAVIERLRKNLVE